MLSRESGEELAEETTSLQKDFPVDLLRVKDSHQYLKLSSWEQDLAPLTQAQLFRVYDLHGTREAFALFEQISSIPGDEILWVSRNDILDGRCSVHNKPDRKSVGEGKSVSVSVDLGGRRLSKKKKTSKERK